MCVCLPSTERERERERCWQLHFYTQSQTHARTEVLAVGLEVLAVGLIGAGSWPDTERRGQEAKPKMSEIDYDFLFFFIIIIIV